MPCWFSPMTSPNQPMNIATTSTKPGIIAQAGSQSFSSATAPSSSVKKDADAMIGHLLSWGT